MGIDDTKQEKNLVNTSGQEFGNEFSNVNDSNNRPRIIIAFWKSKK